MPRKSPGRKATPIGSKAPREPVTEATLRAIEAQAKEPTVSAENEQKINKAKEWLDRTPDGGKPIAAKPSNIKVVRVHLMLHDDGRQYTFRPQGDEVQVLQNCGRDVRRFVLPIEEARQLVAKLWKQDFYLW